MAMKGDRPELEKRLCDHCGSSERWFLHHVRHKGIFKKLCTHCVLRAFPDDFCPICLDPIERSSLPSRERVMCLKCPSVSHHTCVTANSSFHGFQCPPCAKPTFSFFNLNRQDNDGHEGNARLVIDRVSAKALVVAAKISADMMAKFATTAREDAERRVKDAVEAKKKAREALENLTSLVNKQKEKDEKNGGGGVVSAPESLNVKPKLDGPPASQVAPKIAEPEGSNGGLRGDQLKNSHADPMEED